MVCCSGSLAHCDEQSPQSRSETRESGGSQLTAGTPSESYWRDTWRRRGSGPYPGRCCCCAWASYQSSDTACTLSPEGIKTQQVVTINKAVSLASIRVIKYNVFFILYLLSASSKMPHLVKIVKQLQNCENACADKKSHLTTDITWYDENKLFLNITTCNVKNIFVKEFDRDSKST